MSDEREAKAKGLIRRIRNAAVAEGMEECEHGSVLRQQRASDDADAASEELLALFRAPVSERGAEREAGRDLSLVLEHDRRIVALAIDGIRKAINSWGWAMEGRGPYEWDDDRYREEFRRAQEAVSKGLAPLEQIARDWSDCPRDEATTKRIDAVARETFAAALRTPAEPVGAISGVTPGEKPCPRCGLGSLDDIGKGCPVCGRGASAGGVARR